MLRRKETIQTSPEGVTALANNSHPEVLSKIGCRIGKVTATARPNAIG